MSIGNKILYVCIGVAAVSLSGGIIGAIGAMQKSSFAAPYRDDGKTSFPSLRGVPGVYIIKEDGVIVYVGYSASNVYRTMYRHFQEWNHPSQTVITYKGRPHVYSVRVLRCSASQAPRYEGLLILRYNPRDNSKKMEKYRALYESEGGKKMLSNYFKMEEAPF